MKQVRTDIVLNIAVSERLTDAAGMLESQPEVESVQDKNGVLIVKLNEGVVQYSFLANRLIEQGYDLTMFKEDEINLETAFMLTEESRYDRFQSQLATIPACWMG